MGVTFLNNAASQQTTRNSKTERGNIYSTRTPHRVVEILINTKITVQETCKIFGCL